MKTSWKLAAVALTLFGAGCSGTMSQPSTPVPSHNAAAPSVLSGITHDISIPIIETELGSASPAKWAVLGLGGPTNVSITGPSSVRGFRNVGVAGASQFSMSDGLVQGEVIVSGSATTNISGPATITGGVHANDALLTAAVTDAKNASAFYGGLAATAGTPTNINISNPSGNITITATHSTTVVNLTDLVLNGGSTVTLSSPDPNWQFVINIMGRLVIQGGSRVITNGSSPPASHVLYNVLGTGQDVAMGGGTYKSGFPKAELFGVVLATQRNIALSPGFVRPEIIGGGSQITITSGGQVLNHDD
jgi:hypothetical protein